MPRGKNTLKDSEKIWSIWITSLSSMQLDERRHKSEWWEKKKLGGRQRPIIWVATPFLFVQYTSSEKYALHLVSASYYDSTMTTWMKGGNLRTWKDWLLNPLRKLNETYWWILNREMTQSNMKSRQVFQQQHGGLEEWKVDTGHKTSVIIQMRSTDSFT